MTLDYSPQKICKSVTIFICSAYSKPEPYCEAQEKMHAEKFLSFTYHAHQSQLLGPYPGST